MPIFKKRVTRRRVKKQIKKLVDELMELNLTWSGRWVSAQKRKFLQKQFTLKIKIEGLKELL